MPSIIDADQAFRHLSAAPHPECMKPLQSYRKDHDALQDQGQRAAYWIDVAITE